MCLLGINFLNALPAWNGRGGFTLAEMRKLLSFLGEPQDSVPAVHIGGTNGKGSVAASVASILGAQGKSVALTTSPHLSRINERIVIDGVSVSDEKLDHYSREILSACQANHLDVSFFEAITATFFLMARHERVDAIVVEVGLGGRLDATNAISRPEAAAIVTVDFDHEEILGHTIEAIATEKAGIIKEGRPVVTGRLPSDAARVIKEISSAKLATLHSFGNDFWTSSSGDSICTYHERNGSSFTMQPSLKGGFQVHNAAVAVRIGRILGVDSDACQKGISQVYWPGRLELIQFGNSQVLVDAAHNPAGMRGLASFLRNHDWLAVPMLFGALKTKKWREMLDEILPLIDEWWILEPDSSSAVPADEVVSYLISQGKVAKSLNREYEKALTILSRYERSVVAGSIYMSGGIRMHIVKREKPLWLKAVISDS